MVDMLNEWNASLSPSVAIHGTGNVGNLARRTDLEWGSCRVPRLQGTSGTVKEATAFMQPICRPKSCCSVQLCLV